MTITKLPISPIVAITCALALCACAKKSDSDKSGENKGQAPDKQAEKPATPEVNTPTPEATSPVPPAPENVDPPAAGTYLTYNLGLLSAVGLDRQRLPRIIEAMKETRASVVCLQEVWTEADYQAISTALKNYYPHSFRHQTDDTSTYDSAPCQLSQALATQKCAGEMCTPKGISLFECMSDENLCKTQYDAFSDDCKLCLAANTDAATSCAMGTNKAARQSFGGRNGLVLLSWHEIENPTYTEYETSLVNRGVLTATIEGRTVQCTHLSAELDIVPYKKGTFDSWAAEHKAQLPVIDKAGPDKGCRVLLGDMNTGPKTETLMPEIEQNFPGFAAAGWTETWDAPQCTFCPDNELTGVETGRFIDHIFFKGCNAKATYEYSRVFDQSITVKNETGEVKTRLSDHYGVRVEATGL